jgi:hypothetical protein
MYIYRVLFLTLTSSVAFKSQKKSWSPMLSAASVPAQLSNQSPLDPFQSLWTIQRYIKIIETNLHFISFSFISYVSISNYTF